MIRRKKLIIAILLVILLGLLAMIAGALFLGGPDLTVEDKNILVLASDKEEQSHGSVDMAFMVHLVNGSLDNYTPVYPGGMTHPSVASPVTSGNLLLHDSLWSGTDQGMDYAAEIVEANGANYDGARVAAQIVSGIGFLGAGTIIFHKQFIRGLTTAAGMWATAGIGMAIGGGMYFVGVAATVLVLIGLEVLTLAFGKIGLSSISITFYTSDKSNLEKVVGEIHSKKYHLVSYTSAEEAMGGIVMYKAEIVMKIRGHREQNGLFVFIQSLDNVSQLKVE